ncbi:hypothetical protein T07_5462 [Trichinella nelsoni]|uniref:Uncharacterized protein n=1 Tax=Trichinella nelsoni TaxID=6336 RepID=A0A0V0RXM4_9BILA|nr:hypothetical protein T07_5462 [Trichinella nelsoni]
MLLPFLLPLSSFQRVRQVCLLYESNMHAPICWREKISNNNNSRASLPTSMVCPRTTLPKAEMEKTNHK